MAVQSSDPGHPTNVCLAGLVTVSVLFHFLHSFGTVPHSSLRSASQLPFSASCPTCSTKEMMIMLSYSFCLSLGLSFQAWKAPVLLLVGYHPSHRPHKKKGAPKQQTLIILRESPHRSSLGGPGSIVPEAEHSERNGSVAPRDQTLAVELEERDQHDPISQAVGQSSQGKESRAERRSLRVRKRFQQLITMTQLFNSTTSAKAMFPKLQLPDKT